MFTGIVECTGTIRNSVRRGKILEVEIDTGTWERKLRTGDSVCVSGVCLTVAAMAKGRIRVQVVPETSRSTYLRTLRAGHKVNLEGALRASDFLGGHIVTGHVDGVGKILSMSRSGSCFTLQIQAPKVIIQNTIEKGSIAVDGISFTLQKVFKESFEIAVVPHTSKVTNLKGKKSGDRVHLETDLLAKYARKFCGEIPKKTRVRPLKTGGKLAEAFLKAQGF